ncbi:hypothetical protein [Actinoplanes aureus]|uniref:Uncharacterized protein n=1 Tax=Actinoplanes aureus TaxID=2792083 RepID=A0A931CGX4_9ACTN|nr:hypothetical protein [Actinoplanes aureus]MBG0567352.1 hypothetical protein [Actinoplanes aureus]
MVNEDLGEGLVPAGHGDADWVTAGWSAILVVTPFDHYQAILRLEEWDGEPGPEPEDSRGPWQDDVVTVSMDCFGNGGSIGLNQISAGWATTGFSLSHPGRYHVRLARRNGDAEKQARAAVYASFDEADWNGAAFRKAMDAVDVLEEYLIRFWPAM